MGFVHLPKRGQVRACISFEQSAALELYRHTELTIQSQRACVLPSTQFVAVGERWGDGVVAYAYSELEGTIELLQEGEVKSGERT